MIQHKTWLAGLALAALMSGAATAAVINVQLQPIGGGSSITDVDPFTTVNFPTAGDAYCSATNGCGNIPSGGGTGYQWTADDYVWSAIFALPTDGVTDLSANWSFQDFLGDGNTETWNVYVNGVAVALATLPDDNHNGDTLTVTGTVTFSAIGPVSGGWQIELVLQNTVGGGGGSISWLDGGTTDLSYSGSSVPEPGTLALFGLGAAALAAGSRLRRRSS